MRLGVLFRQWLLPAVLAAGILILGALTPGYLLDRQSQALLHSASTVPAEDVRPYGDDYNDMLTALLAAIRLRNSDGFGTESSQQDLWKVRNTIDQFDAFLSELSLQVANRGYWLEGLVQLIYANYSSLTDPRQEEWLLYLDCWDVNSGRYSYAGLVPELGVPVLMALDTLPQEYVDPQALWEALRATYQQRCGLVFTETRVEMSDPQGEDEQTLDQMYFQQWLEEYGFQLEEPAGEDTDLRQSYRFEAVSSDFAVALGMRVTIVNGEHWYIGLWLEPAEKN